MFSTKQQVEMYIGMVHCVAETTGSFKKNSTSGKVHAGLRTGIYSVTLQQSKSATITSFNTLWICFHHLTISLDCTGVCTPVQLAVIYHTTLLVKVQYSCSGVIRMLLLPTCMPSHLCVC